MKYGERYEPGLSRTERGILLNVGEERFRVDVIRPDVLKLAISVAVGIIAWAIFYWMIESGMLDI